MSYVNSLRNLLSCMAARGSLFAQVDCRMFLSIIDISGWRQALGSKTGRGGERLGSDEFCEIGPAAAWMADCPEHIAPKSP